MSNPPSGLPDQSYSDDFALPIMPPVDGASENGALPETAPAEADVHEYGPAPVRELRIDTPEQTNPVAWWEPALVLVSTFLFLAILAPRIITFLSPVTGDEPFYLMTATSMIEDHDINECNNYRQREEARFYPSSLVTERVWPAGWLGWPAAPYPLPPHSTKIVPASRWCVGSNINPVYYLPDTSTPLPTDGTHNELYSKHGLGVSLLITLPYALGDRPLVVYFLNFLAALIAVNIYLFARERTGSAFIAILTWLAFSFTLPLLSYSYLIFPELPAALFIIYAFRRIQLDRNNALQLFLIGICIGFIPWLHYRFAPVSAGLALYFLYNLYRRNEWSIQRRVSDAVLLFLPVAVSAVGLMSYFYFLYHDPLPNSSDHAGISDFAGTIRGVAGSFVDKQWGLLTVSPIYVLALFGLVLLAFRREGRKELLWLGVVALPYFAVISNYAQWWGEWCPPARYMTSILPLLASPFAYAISRFTRVRAVIYGFLYAALLALSLLSSLGFIYQPQWLYNQPVTESALLTKGLQQLMTVLPGSPRLDLQISQALPSFVTPYFAYLKTKSLGDTWSAIAWQKSVLPLAVFGAILLLCLVLAWWQKRATPSAPPTDGAEDGLNAEPLMVRAVRRDAGSPAVTTQFALLPAFVMPGPFPALLRLRPLPALPALSLRARATPPPAMYRATSIEKNEGSAAGVQRISGRATTPHTPDSGPDDSALAWYSVVWRTRRCWLALLALAAGVYGQSLVLHGQVALSIRWYALAVIALLVAWVGSLKVWTFRVNARERIKGPARDVGPATEAAAGRRRLWSRFFVSGTWRYALAAVALAANLVFVAVLRGEHYDSAVGGYGWLASVVLLLVAFIGYLPPGETIAPPETGTEQSAFRLSRRAEIAIIVGIFVLALALRFVRLGDWTLGMHGDEGEAGTDALAILNGSPVSPFRTGWFGQPNFYYYGVALGMRLFGTGLFGLRVFSAVAGSLVVLPVYGLARQWFGPRVAIISGLLVGVSDVAINFSRMEFSNITVPLFMAASLYFLFAGFRTRRTLHFVLSGYAAMLALYFYMGGRIEPFFMAAVLGYLLLFLPLVGLPGAYGRLKTEAAGVGPWALLFRAVGAQFAPARSFLRHLVIFGFACYCFASPLLFFYLDNRTEMDSRTNGKLVFNNAQALGDRYGLNHTPLYVGLQTPNFNDLYPGVPVAFKQTPLSIEIAADGFWPRALWDQLTTSLSILTYRYDVSGVYTWTYEPITKPIEAVLLVLGIAWALWNWRDARMGVLMLWFWSTILVGGVLTIDAPYMARLVGIIPVLAIVVAVTLDKLASETVRALRLIGPDNQVWMRGTASAAGLALLGVVAFLSWQHVYDYYYRYEATAYPFADATGMATLVKDTSQGNLETGRPAPYYYNLGAPDVLWDYAVNRFLNHGTAGEDMANPSDELPLARPGNQDAVFIVWSKYAQYLPILKAYYPGGSEYPYVYTPSGKGDPLFTVFRVSAEEIASRRTTSASYTPAKGARIDRKETGFGTTTALPANLTYPAQATWYGGIVAPAFARYHFTVNAADAAVLSIDGMPILTIRRKGTDASEVDAILANGVHRLQLSATLTGRSDAVFLQWSAGDSQPETIAPNYLWNGQMGGLVGEVRADMPDPFAEPPPDIPSADGEHVIFRRVDGFIGFREAESSMQTGQQIDADWEGKLIVAQAGHYAFDLTSNGGSLLLIDGKTVVDNRAGGSGDHGEIDLQQGLHNLILRYNWTGSGPGLMELYWVVPGGARELIGPDAFDVSVGAWPDGTVWEPPPYTLPEGEGSNIDLTLQGVIGGSGALDRPRGIGIDAQGRVYIGDRGHHRVVVYSAAGKLLREWGKAPPLERQDSPGPGEFADIQDLAVTPDGTVYVMDRGSPMLQVFDANGQYLKSYDIRSWGTYNPTGLTVAGDALYVADTGESRVLRLKEVAGKPQVTEMAGSAAGKAWNQPLSVAVLPGADPSKGSTIAVVDEDSRVVQLSATGDIEQQWPMRIGDNDGGSRIVSLGDSRVLVSDPNRGLLCLLDISTGNTHYFGIPGGDRGQLGVMTGMATGPDGLLYVVNSDRDYVELFKLNITR